ncbi:CGNR zinc finger domain-containing protein [Amycolatopsis deserti]|nr:CGNR zinc finger domain-containing protein [Amycolatopsis deserti]
MTEPLAVAFANTRSSAGRDRIATVDRLRAWARPWPALAACVPRMPAGELPDVLALRDATQTVLHRIAAGESPPAAELEFATWPGLARAEFRVRPAAGGVAVDDAGPEAVRQLLSRAVVDFLLGQQLTDLRRCEGGGCHKVFVSARADRRWCDSRVCGNRARVAAHARRSR